MKRPGGPFSIYLLAIIANYLCIPSLESANYHFGANLICSDCHTIHYSYQHGFTGGGTPGLGTGGPFDKLLKYQAIELCLSCHDGVSGVPDVKGTDYNGGDERAAGQFGELDASNYKGHDITTEDLPRGSPGLCLRCHDFGGGTTPFVTCTDCHNPHGAPPGGTIPSYRNLQWASAPGTEPEIRAFVNPSATGLDKYQRANVAYGAPSPGTSSWREVTNICTDCHHTFTGNYTGTMGNWIRHPVTDSEAGHYRPINRSGANTDPAHWVAGSTPDFTSIGRVPFVNSGPFTGGPAQNYADASEVKADNEVFCLSCHKAHGSDNFFGTIWNYGGGSAGEKAAGCNQCHNK